MSQLAESNINASLLGGLGVGKQIGSSLPAGVSSTKALQFVGSAIADNLPLQFQGNQQTTAALMKILEQTKFLGADQSGKLTSEFLKAFEGDRQRLFAFLNSVNRDGVKTALQTYANQANLPAANQLINAVGLQDAKGKGILDPVTESAVRLHETFENLQAKMDEIIIVLADKLLPVLEKFAALPTGAQAAIVGGGLLGPSALSFLGGMVGCSLPGLGRGALKGIGRGLGAGGRGIGVIGRGLGTLPYGAAWAHAMQGLGAAAPGALAVGAPAVAAGSLYTLGRSVQTAQLERTALGRLEMDQGRTGLFDVANRNRELAQSQLDRLRAERQNLDARLLAMSPDPGMKPGLFSPEIPQADAGQIAKLREQRRKLTEQIQELKLAQPEQMTDRFSGLMEKAQAAIAGFGDKLKDFAAHAREAATAQEYRIKQERYLKTLELSKDASIANANVALKAAEHSLASMHILGPVAAMPEMRALQSAIKTESEKLQALLANIDVSTKDGVIQSLQIKRELVDLQAQSKSLTMQLQNAVLDSIQAQAFQAGMFEKILITRDQNLRVGLEKGIIQPQYTPAAVQHFGSTTPSGTKPVRIRFGDRKPTKTAQHLTEAFKNARDAFEDAARLVVDLEEIVVDDQPAIDRPGSRGRTSL